METTVDRANSPSTASNAIVFAGEHSVVFVHKSAQFKSNISRGLGILLFQKEHPDFDTKTFFFFHSQLISCTSMHTLHEGEFKRWSIRAENDST